LDGFKEGDYWQAGYMASTSEAGGLLIHLLEFVDCRVPEWRVTTEDPTDMKKAPAIPDQAVWRLF